MTTLNKAIEVLILHAAKVVKDESPYQVRFVEHYGELQLDGTCRGEDWQVNGKRFYHAPSEEEVEEAYLKYHAREKEK